MAFKPTKVQQDAIDAKGNVLVSAAAGSGKTAVLTERVVSLICDAENGISADRILVVTFTKAAAAEMRSRIEARLSSEYENNPDNAHLAKQMLLFPNAKICTIDSFCIDLVRQNFDKLGVTPDFKIADNTVLNALYDKAISQVFEAEFAKRDKEFMQLLNTVGSHYDDSVLADFVRKIFDFTRQLPNPNEWLDTALLKGDLETNGNFWFDIAFKNTEAQLDTASNFCNGALNLLEELPEVREKYAPVFINALSNIEKLIADCKNKNWDALYYGVSAFKFDSFSAVRGYTEHQTVIAVKLIRERVNKIFTNLCRQHFDLKKNLINTARVLKPLNVKLVQLVTDYENVLNELMQQRNILTFYNTEQLAFNFLCEYRGGEVVTREQAKDFLNSFDEILVDEYQDTNTLQDLLFKVLSDDEKKLFIVGDVKQSIYGFRGANPKNFIEKKKRYLPFSDTLSADTAKKIILGNNFRSRSEICNYINFFFENLMTEQTGSIAYGQEEMLYPLAEFPEFSDAPVEVTLLDISEFDEKTAVCEADYIADLIIKTMAKGDVIRDENDSKKLRPAKFSDFAVLLRYASKNMPIYAAQLSKRGIPVCFGNDGYLKTAEISTIISLLDVIDNPLHDIPLASVMLSPIFNFTADEVAEIRHKSKYNSLYASVMLNKESNIKCANMLNRLESLRREYASMPLAQFIYRLYDKTDYLNIASAMDNGTVRRANLLMLIDFAAAFEENEGRGISGFIRHMSKLEANGLKSAANTADNDSVKIMSVHMSKGLQFPICIFAACSTKFNDTDTKDSLLIDEDNYFSYKCYDSKTNETVSTLQRQILINANVRKMLEEELRLAYVAMTRAQDKLVLLLSSNNPEALLQKHAASLFVFNGEIVPSVFELTSSFTDWILTSALVHPDGKIFREISGFDLNCKPTDTNFRANFVRSGDFSFEEYNFDEDEQVLPNDEIKQISDKIRSNLNYTYPFERLLTVSSKASVSQLANSAERNKYAFKTQPSFASANGISATERGTAVHKIMQFIDFTAKDIENELERLLEWQFITEREFGAADRGQISAFINSSLCRRIVNSPLVKREMRFLTEKPANQLDKTLGDEFSSEMIVIQGAVDCVFEEDDGMVILDFKTDRVNNLNELVDTYSEQLNIYALACEKIFAKPIKERIIYSFCLNDFIAF